LIKYLLPLAAVAMLGVAVAHVVRSGAEKPLADPARPPPQPPDEHMLSATGVVEARGGNVAVASAGPGVVAPGLGRAGRRVEAGAPLFRLNDDAASAAVRVRQAQLGTAKSRLARLEAPARKDELLVAASRVRGARADVAAKKAALDHAEKLHVKNLI